MRSRRRAGGGPWSGRRSTERGGWYRLAHALMRRPVPVAVAATALLLVLGLPFLSIRFTGVDASVLPPSASSRVVDTALRNDFAPTAASPAYAVLHADAARAREYALAVRRLPQAALVLPPRRLSPGAWELRASSGQPFLADASQRLVRGMRSLPGDALVGGATAQFLDQKHALGSRLALAVGLLCVVTFLLLYRATRVTRAAAEDAPDERAHARRDVRDPRLRLPGRPARGAVRLPRARARSS